MDNPADKQLYDHINEIKNFSGYMKSLISDDIRFKRNAIKVEVGKK